jgi:hypothetical protein
MTKPQNWKRIGIRAALAAGVLTGGIAFASTRAGASTDGYTADVTNPYFPLVPGRTLVYQGTKDGKAAVEYLFTTHQVVKIDGKPVRVVLDKTLLDGQLGETTVDYYTQDGSGNVHYYGEDTAEVDKNGNMVVFGTDGTWHAAEFGAKPGIFMPDHLAVGDSYRQELLKGHAEDYFKILDLDTPVSTPYRDFAHAVRTKEWTPLEPGVIDNKYYVKGIGTVKEVTVKGGTEEFDLVDIR